jgi:spore germination cell wall hydrolase CwlJ-like protein
MSMLTSASRLVRTTCFGTVVLTAVAALPATVAGDAEEAHSCLAQTLYFEAKSEGRHGMVAVGWVVLNRMRDGEFPRSVCGVVKQGREKPGCQFSYWCDGKSDKPKADDEWMLAQDVARDLLSNPPPDPTGGATFYHAVEVKAPWTVSRQRTGRIGRHVYYR